MDRQTKIRQVWDSFIYCMSLSWKSSKFYTIMQLLTMICVALAPVLMTCNTKEILDLPGSVHTENAAEQLILRIGIQFLLAMVQLVAAKAGSYAAVMQQSILMHNVERDMARTALEMELEYFDNSRYYDAFEAVKRDIYSVPGAVFNGISVISVGISVCSCAILLGMVSPLYTGMVLAASIPAAFSEHTYTKKIYLWGLEHIREERKMQYLYRTATERAYAQEIRLYGTGQYLLDKYQRLWDMYFSEKRTVARARALWNLGLSVLPESLSAAAMVHIGIKIIHGERTIGDFILYSGLLTQLIAGLGNLVSAVMELYEKKLKLNHFSEFQAMAKEKKKNGTKKLESPVTIEFRNVSFRYPDTEQYVLKDISFCLQQGKKLCMVGENGAGKTTILKLLMRFYEPQEGLILINDIPIGEYDRESLYQAFSCFFQKACNYAFHLQENVRISQIGYDEETAKKRQEEALRKAGADTFLKKLKNGTQTYLSRAYSEDGIELSGGQNQKIALARMFYRDAPVLVLDEPTADLDPQGEHELFHTLAEECRETSILFVSHRLANVFLADEILVMEDGHILARGRHEDLLQDCVLYRRLFHYQADKYRRRGEYENSSNR